MLIQYQQDIKSLNQIILTLKDQLKDKEDELNGLKMHSADSEEINTISNEIRELEGTIANL
jgi:hypothetical protein